MKFLFYHWGSYIDEMLFSNEATPKNPLIHTTCHILPQGTDCIKVTTNEQDAVQAVACILLWPSYYRDHAVIRLSMCCLN